MASAEPTLTDLRDCALLALGLEFASRRSELVGLDLEAQGDGTGVLEFAGDDGAIVRLLKGKTVIDKPDDVHVQLGVALKATRLWIEQGGIAVGTPLFRGIGKRNRVSPTHLCDRMVSRIVKKRVEDMGLDPKEYSGHSLRSGSITASFEAGLAAWIIKLTSRHKSTQILEGYNEPLERKKHALTNAIGL